MATLKMVLDTQQTCEQKTKTVSLLKGDPLYSQHVSWIWPWKGKSLKHCHIQPEEGCVITHFLRRSRLLYFSTAPLNSSTDTESSACGTIALTFLLMASNFAFTGSLDMWSFIFYGSKKITVKDSIIWPRALTMTLKQHY